MRPTSWSWYGAFGPVHSDSSCAVNDRGTLVAFRRAGICVDLLINTIFDPPLGDLSFLLAIFGCDPRRITARSARRVFLTVTGVLAAVQGAAASADRPGPTSVPPAHEDAAVPRRTGPAAHAHSRFRRGGRDQNVWSGVGCRFFSCCANFARFWALRRCIFCCSLGQEYTAW